MTAPLDLDAIDAKLDNGERLDDDTLAALVARVRAADAEVARLREAARTLADFAGTAPGRLPEPGAVGHRGPLLARRWPVTP